MSLCVFNKWFYSEINISIIFEHLDMWKNQFQKILDKMSGAVKMDHNVSLMSHMKQIFPFKKLYYDKAF